MASTFPNALDTIPDAPVSQALGGSTPTHTEMHDLLRDAIVALQTTVGITDSEDANSLEHRLAAVVSSAPPHKRAVFLGDSIMADSFSVGGIWNDWGWLCWARRHLARKMKIDGADVLAAGGHTIAQCLSLQVPQVQAGVYSDAFVCVGVNSIASYTAISMIADKVAIIDALLDRVKTVWVLAIRAKGNAPALTVDENHKLTAFNRWLHDYGRQEARVRVIDPNQIYMDWATGFPRSIYLRDNTHDNQCSAAVFGKHVADLVGVTMPDQNYLCTTTFDAFDAVKNPRGNLLTNTAMTGSGGTKQNGALGTVPTGWTAARSAPGATYSATYSVDADTTGENPTLPGIVITVGATADGGQCNIYQDIDVTSLLAVGDKTYCECEIEWDAASSGVAAIALYSRIQTAAYSTLDETYDGYKNTTYGMRVVAPGKAVYRTEEMEILATTKWLRWSVVFYVQLSGSAAGTIKIRRPAMRKVV